MPTEYVIRGNSAIMKCSVPSFVADFITVEAWVTNDGQTYSRDSVKSGKQNILERRKKHNHERTRCIWNETPDDPKVQNSTDFVNILWKKIYSAELLVTFCR